MPAPSLQAASPRARVCGTAGLIATLGLAGCPDRGGPFTVLPPALAPACGPTIERQEITLLVDSAAPTPDLLTVEWKFRVYCAGRAGDPLSVRSSYLEVRQGRGADFIQIPADGFDGLGIGHLGPHGESWNSATIVLDRAQQANWCIEGRAMFRDVAAPVSFGPVTIPQVVGTSAPVLCFLARGPAGSISIVPAFDHMDGCIASP